MIFIGIESSCDDTSVGVFSSQHGVLSNVRYTQSIHSQWGGVMPEYAAREHMQSLSSILKESLSIASITPKNINGIGVTCGPGLSGGLIVGLSSALGLSMNLGAPVIAVNHLQAHSLSARIEHSSDLDYPFISVLLSGGNCQVILVESPSKMKIIGATLDDAPGEVIDKIGREMGMQYPAGPELERTALKSDKKFSFNLPVPMAHNKTNDFSFSGLKTAAKILINKNQPLSEEFKADLSYALQDSIAEAIISRMNYILTQDKYRQYKNIAIVGGVASNQYLRNKINSWSKALELSVFVPSLEYCVDNGAMIAYSAKELVMEKGLDYYKTFNNIPKINPRWSVEKIS